MTPERFIAYDSPRRNGKTAAERFINGEPARIVLHGVDHIATFQRRPIDHVRIVSAAGTRIESRFMAARDVPAWLALQTVVPPKED